MNRPAKVALVAFYVVVLAVGFLAAVYLLAYPWGVA